MQEGGLHSVKCEVRGSGLKPGILLSIPAEGSPGRLQSHTPGAGGAGEPQNHWPRVTVALSLLWEPGCCPASAAEVPGLCPGARALQVPGVPWVYPGPAEAVP